MARHVNQREPKLLLDEFRDYGKELGSSPRLVVCPLDIRTPAASFTNGFNNTHLSYFVGVGQTTYIPFRLWAATAISAPDSPTPDPN